MGGAVGADYKGACGGVGSAVQDLVVGKDQVGLAHGGALELRWSGVEGKTGVAGAPAAFSRRRRSWRTLGLGVFIENPEGQVIGGVHRHAGVISPAVLGTTEDADIKVHAWPVHH